MLVKKWFFQRLFVNEDAEFQRDGINVGNQN